MRGGVNAVHPNVRHVIAAVKTQQRTPALKIFHGKFAAVPNDAVRAFVRNSARFVLIGKRHVDAFIERLSARRISFFNARVFVVEGELPFAV